MKPVLLSEWAAVTKTQICVCIVLFSTVFDLHSAAVDLQLFNTVLTHLSSRGRYTIHFTAWWCVLYTWWKCAVCLVEPTSHMLLGHSDLQSTPELWVCERREEEKWNVRLKESSPQHSETATKGFFCSLFIFELRNKMILFASWGTFWLNNKTEISHTYVDAHEGSKRKEYGKVVEHT